MTRNYWIVSPNVGNHIKKSEVWVVDKWKQLIRNRQVALLGWSRNTYKKKHPLGARMSELFAGEGDPSVQIGDVILIARGRITKDVVAAGVVDSESWEDESNEYRKLNGGDPIQLRKLNNFVWLAGKEYSHLPLEKALPSATAMTMKPLNVKDPDIKKLCEWLEQELNVSKEKKGSSRGFSYQPDLKKRQAVEREAYKAVEKYYRDQKYEVNDVQNENQGYDLIAIKNGDTLRVEVKGRSDNIVIAELTPNEYTHFKQDENYRLCIVINALERKPKKEILEFVFDQTSQKWVDQKTNRKLDIKEKPGAIVHG